ncbi:hypothetical protein Tco_0534889 [Tanacetum coccineum]
MKSTIRGFSREIKGNVTSFKDLRLLHAAINMARELIEHGFRLKGFRFGDSNKRKWEDQQGNNYHQQQKPKDKKLLRVMAAPTKGLRPTLGTYHGAIGARHIISQVRVLLGVIAGVKGTETIKANQG